MSQYLRSNTQGATFFFTVVAYNRRNIFCEPDFLKAFKNSIKEVQMQYPFEILAWVQLPDHLHCIWRLPEQDSDYGKRWSMIKRFTTKACPQYHLEFNELSYSKVARNEKGIWQRRFHEHQIRDEADFKRHMDYIHYNPVKHGLVNSPNDWQYSSFHRYVKQGIYTKDWGSHVKFEQRYFEGLE